MLFCPTCANILMVEECPESGLRYACNTCPYVYNIRRKVSSKTFPKLKFAPSVHMEELFLCNSKPVLQMSP
ncbi:unnamed protein product [Leptidea sinapis]|uniref:DNA-directed RNA polymerase II subunit RPB9-like zinc ribbon domain-containing protein n=1 Tax=Leptidea sinapis TaxID=189913 RepID=A0A5E4PRA3_9NEOP|nr:unnamed protein product [Leptidea sinapis]